MTEQILLDKCQLLYMSLEALLAKREVFTCSVFCENLSGIVDEAHLILKLYMCTWSVNATMWLMYFCETFVRAPWHPHTPGGVYAPNSGTIDNLPIQWQIFMVVAFLSNKNCTHYDFALNFASYQHPWGVVTSQRSWCGWFVSVHFIQAQIIIDCGE